jgi:HTH-type transcriptional regulator, competence development regulator
VKYSRIAQERERGKEMTLGQKVKERRLALNYTLRELAKLADMDFTYLSKIENDKTDRPPSEELLGRLAKHLDIDAGELVILSGQVPHEMKELLTKDESALRFFRSMAEKGADWDDLDKLLKRLPQRK